MSERGQDARTELARRGSEVAAALRVLNMEGAAQVVGDMAIELDPDPSRRYREAWRIQLDGYGSTGGVVLISFTASPTGLGVMAEALVCGENFAAESSDRTTAAEGLFREASARLQTVRLRLLAPGER